MPTPPLFWSFRPSTDWPSAAWLYGGPYVALVVVPASSPVAVAMTSAGSALAHPDIVIAGSSGEEKTAAEHQRQHGHRARAITNSLTRS